MFARITSTLVSRSLRNNTKFYSNFSLLYSKNKMNNSPYLPPQQQVNEPLLYSSNNSSNSSFNLRQYSTNSAHNNEEMKRWSWAWWKEMTIIITVFAITGSTTVRIVRPIVTDVFGIEGSFLEGPWSYRLAYLSITLPLYSIVLIGVGSIFRRYNYFKRFVFKMWGRFIPNKLKLRLSNKRNDNGSNNLGV